MAIERSRTTLLHALENGSPLRKGVYLLPNLLTTGGLFAGFYSIVASLHGEFQVAAVAILIANIFDALDGRVARLTRTSTRFGIEYDSLADLVAFGVAPAMLIYCWALEPWGSWGWLAAALYLTCAALRLARFNVQFDSVEKRHFLGLPSPAAAEAIAATVLLFYRFGAYGPTDKHLLLLLVTYGLAALMVSTLPYFSFKETDLLRRQPFWTLLVAILLIKLLIAEPQVFLFVSFYGYALFGPARFLWVMSRRFASRRRSHADGSSQPPAAAHSTSTEQC
ncbi:MAG: CDP-diacylglycerol--serine O-phosphatidyltransferase [Candidatus Binatia bacterium]|nr:CDP-diacylglycerol--serine O-phosphatidyltransferase [Candidatus Binatia bacterium]